MLFHSNRHIIETWPICAPGSKISKAMRFRAVAEVAGVKPAAVQKWYDRDAIPPAYWPQIEAARSDLTFDDLRRFYRHMVAA
jgi:hypothetical protein